MPRLMIGYGLFLVDRDDFVLFLQSAHNAVHSIQKILPGDALMTFAGGDQGRFVTHIGNIGTRKSGSLLGQETHLHILIEFQRLQVHIEDFGPFVQIGEFHVNLAVETAGTHQRPVEDIGPVGGRQHNYPAVGIESVHFREQLVEGVLTLVVGAEIGVPSAGPPNGVNLVDKNNTGRLFLGLLEEIPYPRSPYPYKHLHKIGTRHGKEGHVGLTGHCLGQQGLSCSGRPYQ